MDQTSHSRRWAPRLRTSCAMVAAIGLATAWVHRDDAHVGSLGHASAAVDAVWRLLPAIVTEAEAKSGRGGRGGRGGHGGHGGGHGHGHGHGHGGPGGDSDDSDDQDDGKGKDNDKHKDKEKNNNKSNDKNNDKSKDKNKNKNSNKDDSDDGEDQDVSDDGEDQDDGDDDTGGEDGGSTGGGTSGGSTGGGTGGKTAGGSTGGGKTGGSTGGTTGGSGTGGKVAEPDKTPSEIAGPRTAARRLDHDRGDDGAEVRAGEVIAIDPSGEVIASLATLGFVRRSTTELQALGTTIVLLETPAGTSSLGGRNFLRSAFPGVRFVLNEIYRGYQPAASDAAPGAMVAEGQGACEDDRCYGRDAIDWRQDAVACAAGLRIGVIDAAVDVEHPAFGRRKPVVEDFTSGFTSEPGGAHGTAIVSMLAGDPASSTPGLVPDSQVLAANVFYTEADGTLTADTASIVKALDWLASNRVDIVNMSYAGPADPLVEAAIDAMSRRGMLFVAAAGNNGPNGKPGYPAAYPQVIAVTAVGANLASYRYSNRGSYIDVAAPGVRIWAALPGGRAGYQSGTSFAAPHVTAILAANWSTIAGASGKAEVLDRLRIRDLGSSGPDPVYGRGLVLAPQACKPAAPAGAAVAFIAPDSQWAWAPITPSEPAERRK